MGIDAVFADHPVESAAQAFPGGVGRRVGLAVGDVVQTGDAGGGRERVGVEGALVGDAAAAVPTGLIAHLDLGDELPLPGDGATGEPAGQDLGQRGHVGGDAEFFLVAAGAEAEPGDDFVEDQRHVQLGADGAQLADPFHIGGAAAAAGAGRLQDDAGVVAGR